MNINVVCVVHPASNVTLIIFFTYILLKNILVLLNDNLNTYTLLFHSDFAPVLSHVVNISFLVI